MEFQEVYGSALFDVVFGVVLLIPNEDPRRTGPRCVWTVLEKQSCLFDAFRKFADAFEHPRKRLRHQSRDSHEHSLEEAWSSALLKMFLRVPIKSSNGEFAACVESKESVFRSISDVFTLLHLNFFSSGDELLIEGDIGDAMWAALAHDLKGVAGTCDDISGEEDSSFDDSDGSFDGSFDEPFWRLVDDFPNALSQVPKQHVWVAEDIDRYGYFVYLFEYLFPVELSELIGEVPHIDISLVESRQDDLRFWDIRECGFEQCDDCIDDDISSRGRFDAERKLNGQFPNLNLSDEYRLIFLCGLFLHPFQLLDIGPIDLA